MAVRSVDQCKSEHVESVENFATPELSTLKLVIEIGPCQKMARDILDVG
jgi:hypothetical protein